MKYKFFYFLIVCAILTGCSKNESPVSQTSDSSPAVSQDSAKTLDAATAGSLKGKVYFEGEAPAPKELPIKGNPECSALHPDGKLLSEDLIVRDGGLKNVFIYVKQGLEGYSFPTPAESVTIDNKNCIYVPHVSGVQTNQEVILHNSDATLHNVHSYSKNSKSWNLGLPFQGMKQTKKFANSEVMLTLKCDVHPWMMGYVGILPHPYFAVTDETGSFEINNLPPGEYVLEAWHEKLGTQSQTIKIGPQETAVTEFKFS